MAEFVYKSTLYGHRTFTVEDEGGVVFYKGQKLDAFGGYYSAGKGSHPLRADARTLEGAARRWWRKRTEYLSSFGHKANGVDP